MFVVGKKVESNRTRRGAPYIRYSSRMQDDSFSLQAQERQIRDRARQDGVEIIDHVFADPATSAYSQKVRPGVEAMLEAARRGEFDVLYIHKVDRLARRLKWALAIVEELTSLGITVVAVEQNFNLATPEGKLIFNFLCSLGEFYSDNLSRETHKGKRERALEGYHNGAVPWGYRSEWIEGKKRAVLIPALGPVLQELFELYSSGNYSDQQLADWLTARGFRMKDHLFTKDNLRVILHNPFYTGLVRYRGTRQRGSDYRNLKGEWVPGKHEAAVSLELFERCQAVRAARERKVKTLQHTQHVYYLNGLIVCAHCGRRLRAQSAPHWNYYREVSPMRGYTDCPSGGRSVPADDIDAQAAALMQALSLPADWERLLRDLLTAEREGPDPEAERQKLRAELHRLRDNYELGAYVGEEDVYKARVEKVRAQLAMLEERTPAQAQVVAAGQVLVNLPQVWKLSTKEEQRQLVQLVLEEVGCDVMARRVEWVKPRAGLEVLFRLVPGLEPPDEMRRYHLAPSVD